MTLGLLPIFVLFALFTMNVPVAFGLIASTMTYFLFINTSMPVDMIFQRMISSAESFSLLAVPFFVTAGVVMNFAGISSKLMDMAEVLTGHMKGGLAQVNVVLSAFMGGVSGSANADAAMDSKILVPQMVKRGMSPAFSAAITAASSVITPIIPPGIGLIIYAFMADASVGKMFLAGYIPGIMLCVALMIAVAIVAKRRDYQPSRAKRASLKEVLIQLRHSSWALFLPLGIILGLRFGMFTPTEAGAMTVIYSILVGFFVYKELKLEHFPQIILESVLGTAGVMLIICAASAFGYYMSWEQLPQKISAFLLNLTKNPWLMLFILNLFLLFLGMFIEGTATLIILTPLLVPAITALGIDPIHFGIVMVVNLTIGGVTPPFGTLMFLTCSIVKVPLGDFMKEAVPFIIAMISVLFIITYIPGLVTFVPNLLMK